MALGRGRGHPPHVGVMVVDTLRADRPGAYGSSSGLPPFRDHLARGGTLFRNAYAASSWTCASVACLFTSRCVSRYPATTWDARLAAADSVKERQRLRARGYVD
jgi:arylsulfatase A-like enzyme